MHRARPMRGLGIRLAQFKAQEARIRERLSVSVSGDCNVQHWC